MKENERISIIIATYNAENKIINCVESILSQKYNNIELIIIDGGSSDKTIEILDEYSNNISYLISEKDSGIYDALNKGLAVATGEFIYVMGADDRLCDENVFQAFIDISRIHIADIYYGNFIQIFNHNYKVRIVPRKIISRTYLFRNFGINHQSILARKKTLISGFDTRYKISSDLDWLIKSFNSGFKFQYMDIDVTNYSMTGTSALYVENLIDDICDIYSRYIGKFLSGILRIFLMSKWTRKQK